jgi:hypothetical protein
LWHRLELSVINGMEHRRLLTSAPWAKRTVLVCPRRPPRAAVQPFRAFAFTGGAFLEEDGVPCDLVRREVQRRHAVSVLRITSALEKQFGDIPVAPGRRAVQRWRLRDLSTSAPSTSSFGEVSTLSCGTSHGPPWRSANKKRQ